MIGGGCDWMSREGEEEERTTGPKRVKGEWMTPTSKTSSDWLRMTSIGVVVAAE